MTMSRVEVIASVQRRRRWSRAEKERLVAATLEPGVTVLGSVAGSWRASDIRCRLIAGLRTALYPRLVVVANDWNARMGIKERHPDTHAAFVKECRDAARSGRRRCSSNTCGATSTACTKTSMATLPSRSRWRSCPPSRGVTSPDGCDGSPSCF